MGRKVGFCCALFALLLHTVVAEGAQSPKIVLQINENHGAWTGHNDPKTEGGENLVYYSLGYITQNYGITVLGSHAGLSYSYNGGNPSGDFYRDQFLDSIISGYYMLKNFIGLDVRLGVDLNLPTGDPGFTNEALDRLNLDNVTQEFNLATSFGQGFNVAPNILATRAISQKLVLGMGARYEFTGEYDPTLDVPNDNYDPGDSFMLVGLMQYIASKQTTLFLDTNATFMARDRQGGADVFNIGKTYDLTLRLVHGFSAFRATFGASYSIQEKNQSLDATGITTEDRNSNNNNYELFTNFYYPFTRKINFTGILGYKKVLENDLEPTDSLFDGGYNKIHAGMGVAYNVSDSLYVSFDLRGFQIVNMADGYETENNAYRGFNADIGFVYTFPISRREKGERLEKSDKFEEDLYAQKKSGAIEPDPMRQLIEKNRLMFKPGEARLRLVEIRKHFGEMASRKRTGPPRHKEAEIVSRLLIWAKALSDRDGEKFVSFYSGNYSDSVTVNPSEWRRMKVEELAKEEWIKATVGKVKVKFISNTRAEVRFEQEYSSATSKRLRILGKVMVFAKVKGLWLIISEARR